MPNSRKVSLTLFTESFNTYFRGGYKRKQPLFFIFSSEFVISMIFLDEHVAHLICGKGARYLRRYFSFTSPIFLFTLLLCNNFFVRTSYRQNQLFCNFVVKFSFNAENRFFSL